MNDEQLNRVLRSGRVPERSPEYWTEFPEVVVRALQRGGTPVVAGAVGESRLNPVRRRRSIALALAAACVVLGVIAGFRLGRLSAPRTPEGLAMSRYLRELEALFPQQIQALVVEQGGMRLMLSDRPDVPISAPVYLRICDRDGDAARCRTVITFSGQRVRLNGDEFEVLLDAGGGVIVVARQGVWSSDGLRSTSLPFRIQAHVLENAG